MDQQKKKKNNVLDNFPPTFIVFVMFVVMLLLAAANPIYDNALFGIGFWGCAIIGLLCYEILNELGVFKKGWQKK